MSTSFYTSANIEDWHHTLRRIGVSDVYLLPEYHHAYELNGDGIAHLYVFESGESRLAYPFMLRPIKEVGGVAIDKNLYDIETVYGYSGPIATTCDRQFLAAAWATFADWCVQKRVVAEFIRFHPLLENKVFLEGFAEISCDRETVVIDLNGSPEDLWSRYSSSQRSKIRRAEKDNLVCRMHDLGEGLPHFRKLYERTMQNLEATRYYFFGDAYFKELASLNDYGRIFSVYQSDMLIASALFLFQAPYLHYHLGGSDPAYRTSRPNNLLFHTAGLWGQEHDCRWLHLGGGRTSSSEDELLRFKSTFSRERRFFYIGRRVHCQKTFDWLCAEWIKRKNATERPPYFMMYRLPV